MTSPDDDGRKSSSPEDEQNRLARKEQQDAFAALSTMISGVLVWGGIGWLVARWLDNQVFTMVGLLLGIGAAWYLLWVRYGRQ